MSRLNSNYIDVVGAWVDSSEELFDSSNINRSYATNGVHLRWSFGSSLGFPEDGFIITKIDSDGTEHPPINLALPESATEFLNRIFLLSALSEAVLRERYERGADWLLEFVNSLRDTTNPIPIQSRLVHDGDGSKPLSLRAVDAIMLASLDPHIAYGLGLYYIGALQSLQGENSYRVAGTWGDQPWPKYKIDLSSFRKTNARDKWIGPDLTLITSGRSFDLEELETDDYVIRCRGESNTSLRFIFPFSVSVLEITLQYLVIPIHEWRVELGDDRDVTVESDPGTAVVTIQASDRGQFDRLTLSSNVTERWTISAIEYREFRGEIGELNSDEVRLSSTRTQVPIPEIFVHRHSYLATTLSQENGLVMPANQIELGAIHQGNERSVMAYFESTTRI